MTDPTPLYDLDGGVGGFRELVCEAIVTATVAQGRLADTLAALAETPWACDPRAGTLVLGGRTFAAEMLGTLESGNWLWVWANPDLNLPAERTTLSRAARDAGEELGCEVLRTPFVDLRGDATEADVAALVIAHGRADAYFVCEYPDSRVVYALGPGQLRPTWPRLYELQRALDALLERGETDLWMAIELAARSLKLRVEKTEYTLVVHDGEASLTAEFEMGLTLVKVTSTVER